MLSVQDGLHIMFFGVQKLSLQEIRIGDANEGFGGLLGLHQGGAKIVPGFLIAALTQADIASEYRNIWMDGVLRGQTLGERLGLFEIPQQQMEISDIHLQCQGLRLRLLQCV